MADKIEEQNRLVDRQIAELRSVSQSVSKQFGMIMVALRKKSEQIEDREQRQIVDELLEHTEKFVGDVNVFALGLVDAIVTLQADYDLQFKTMTSLIEAHTNPSSN